LLAVSVGTADIASMEAVKEHRPRVYKNPLARWDKNCSWVHVGLLLRSLRRSIYRRVFKRDPLGCQQTAVAVSDRHGRLTGAWQSAAATWDALFDGVICAGLQMAGKDDLLSCPNSGGEGARTAMKHGVEAIVEPLEWWNCAATTHPDEGGAEEVSSQLEWQQGPALCLLGREKAEISMSFENLFTI
jgi:hypothetical protein